MACLSLVGEWVKFVEEKMYGPHTHKIIGISEVSVELSPAVCSFRYSGEKAADESFHLGSVLVCSSHHNKVLWTERIDQQKFHFLTIPEAGIGRSGCQHGWVLAMAVFLVCRWEPPAVCSHGLSLVHEWTERSLSLSFSSGKAISPIKLGSNSYDLINPKLPPKGPISKCN